MQTGRRKRIFLKMSTNKRNITYAKALSEAMVSLLSSEKGAFIIGLGVSDYKGIFGTTIEAHKLFGPSRVIETPASENALTGIVIGAALTGKKPVIIHARNDFMFLTLDQMLNTAAKWKYVYGGKSKIPFVVRGIIGKGWGQGPTHSQSIQSVFMHFPGLNVAMPSTPYDAKNLILSAFNYDAPTVILEHRALYNTVGHVPKKFERINFGKARIVAKGKDVTIVAVSVMVQEAVKAKIALAKMGVSLEIIDPRTLVPLDEETIIESVKKTGKLIVADTSWARCGFPSEVSSIVAEKAFKFLKAPIKRLGLADSPAPVSKVLEDLYYPTYKDIVRVACVLTGKKVKENLIKDPIIDNFRGPY